MKWPFKQVVYLIAFMVVAGCHSIDLPGVQCKQENDTSSYSSTMKEITTYTRYTYLRTGVSETIYKYEYDEGAKSYLITVNWGWDGAYDNRWYNPYVVYWGSLDLYTSSTNMVLGFNVI